MSNWRIKFVLKDEAIVGGVVLAPCEVHTIEIKGIDGASAAQNVCTAYEKIEKMVNEGCEYGRSNVSHFVHHTQVN